MRKKSWLHRIQEACANSNGYPFDVGDIDDAASWNTCAVGEVSKKMVRKNPLTTTFFYDGEPIDGELQRWGYEFYRGMKAQDCERVTTAYENIQRRANELVKETV